MTSPLSVVLDCAEPRLAYERLIVPVDGTLWDMRVSSNVFLDYPTRTMMLMPLPLTDAWQSTYSGNYARYGASSYALTTSSAWVEVPGPSGDIGDTYLMGLGTNEAVTTTTTFGTNQAIYLAQFIPGSEVDYRPALEFGWGVKGASGSVWVRLHKDGTVDIFKGAATEPVATYDLKGQAGLGVEKRAKKSDSIAGRFHSLMVIPCRGRELLFLSSQGAGFTHAFDDLDPLLTDQTITPAGTFWWQAQNGQPHVQFAPLKYETSGTAYGRVSTLRYAPSGSRVFDPIPAQVVPLSCATTFSVVKADLSSYSPDGTTTAVRAKATLAGTGSSTPFLYAVDMHMDSVKTTTADAETDITSYVTALSLSVPEHGPASCQIKCRQPEKLESEGGLALAQVIGDRPYRIAMNGIDLIRGRLSMPHVTLGPNAETDIIEWEGKDRDADLDDYYFPDSLPYDGLTLTDVASDLSTSTGATTGDVIISTDSLRLPFLPSISEGDWQLLPERGDTPGSWLDRIHKDYAATWVSGWVPTLSGYKRMFVDPDDLSDTPVMSLYETTADAAAAGIASNRRANRVVRQVRLMPEAAEANQVMIIGYDKATRKYITAQYDDAASQTPGTLPASRPLNWRGFTSRYQLIDAGGISNQVAADRAKDIISARITGGRDIVEIDCDLLIREDDRPLWKGDVVRLYFARETSEFVARGNFRILSIPNIEWVIEHDLASIHVCAYVLERIGD